MIAVVIGLLAASGLTAVGIVWVRSRERQQTAATRYSAWANIARDIPSGSTIATLEPEAQAWIEIGRPFRQPESPR
jgi:hypothetical protein